MALLAELQAEVDAGRPFHYDWDCGLPIVHPDLAAAQHCVATAIGPAVREALAGGGRALDVACNEGWWSHRLLDWGAGSVLAVEAREANARRARLLRTQYGIAANALDVLTADATTLDPGAVGTFAVALHLGLLYHLEDPIGSLRTMRSLVQPGGLLCVETQAVPTTEIRHAWGSTDDRAETAHGVFAVRWERDDAFALASVDSVVSLVPDRAALELSLAAAGFGSVEICAVPGDAPSGFVSGDRLIALAR